MASPYGRKLTPEQRDEIARRYLRGERCSDLAREFGCSRPNVLELAERRGLPLHGHRSREKDFDHAEVLVEILPRLKIGQLKRLRKEIDEILADFG